MRITKELYKAWLQYRANLTADNFDTLPPVRLPQGTDVLCNGYEGVIVRHYYASIHEVRLPGGVCATGSFTVLPPIE